MVASNYSFSGNIGWFTSPSDLSWRATATGDFNNDGNADIVWRRESSGDNLVWFMSGTNMVNNGYLPQNTLPGAALTATGHFNREGHTDLVWRDTSGINSIWLIGGSDGLTFRGAYPIPSEADQDWVIKGTGGYTNTMALSADVSDATSTITLKWQPGLTTTTSIKRKLPTKSQWTDLASNYYRYTYTNISMTLGQKYEFDVGGNYMVSAIKASPEENRGNVILVVESSVASTLAVELATLRTNLIGDGWSVIRTDVARHDDINYTNIIAPIASIKSFITNNYNSSVTNVVFIIGHVPIPYSGLYASDNHHHTVDSDTGAVTDFEHGGAWVADAFYGSTSSSGWTDRDIDFINIDYPENTNVPSDGKLYQNYLPLTQGMLLQLAVGRIDFAKLPAFETKTESDLLRRYLMKDSSYRKNQIALNDRTTVGGFFSLAPPFDPKAYDNRNDTVFHNARKNATRWFGIGPGKLVHGDIFYQTSESYLWGFTSGSGAPAGQQGDGSAFHTTFDLVNSSNEPRTAFYFLHGSWFADWNLTTNSFLRACLATRNYGLAVFGNSSINPISFKMESLGLGDPLAYSMLQTCVSLGGAAPRWLTILGDPTLRLKMPTPPASLTATGSNPINLLWPAVSEAVNYYVYRSTNGLDGPWARIAITSNTSFPDSNPPGGPKLYMIRAEHLTVTGCGSYFNLSLGVFASSP